MEFGVPYFGFPFIYDLICYELNYLIIKVLFALYLTFAVVLAHFTVTNFFLLTITH